MPCPNKNLQIWKNLVEAVGDVNAQWAFNLNQFDIPTVEQAILLLDAQKQQDETTSNPKTNKIRNSEIARIDSQISTIDRVIKTAPADARIETLNKLKANLQEYRKILEEGRATVSVSNLFGGGEIANKENFKNYADFGTFLHHIVETLQEELAGTGRSLTSAFSRPRLKELLKSYPNEFTINGLIEQGMITNEDELYNMSIEMLGILQNYTSMGYTVLPEIRIVTKDRNNQNIVGRLDMLAINNKGAAVVIDLKSKKVESVTSKDPLSKYYDVNSSKFTAREFTTGKRNAYENWDIQLGIYSRMLQQIGIATDEKRIVSLLYYGSYNSLDGKQFSPTGEDTFTYEFYRIKSYLSSEFDKTNDYDFVRYKNNMRSVADVLPTAEKDEPVIKDKNKDEFVFNLSKEESDKLVNSLMEITDKELKNSRGRLNDAVKKDAGKSVIKYYEERINALDKMRQALKKGNWDSPHKVGYVIGVLDENIKSLVDTVAEIKPFMNIDGLSKRIQDLERLNRTAIGYSIVTNEVRRLLVEAGVSNESNAIKTLNNIDNNIGRVKGEYANLGFKSIMSLLKNSIDGIQVTRIEEQRRQLIEPRLNKLRKDRDNLLKEGKDAGYWYRISRPIGNVVKSIVKQDISPKSQLEDIEFKIQKLELELEGIKLDDDALKKYIEAVLDPSSPAYIGQGTSFWTQYMASADSRDWVVSAYSNKLKMAISTGEQQFINFIEREKIQQEFDAYKQGERNVTKLNEAISEVRNARRFDANGNEIVSKVRSFVNPISQEYYDIIDTYRNESRKLIREIRDAADTAQTRELKSKLKDLKKSHLEWRLANTQMERVAEFYELDKLLPEEYKQERDELYEEKTLLEQSAGYNNAEELDASTVFRIAEIEVELNKLRKKYADMQEGGYARYLELQEKFFTYEVNQNYFDRLFNQKKIELTDINGNIDIEALSRWKQQNMIKRPKGEWYELVGQIWDDVFTIIGNSNPAVEELKERYKEILTQYRRRGAVDSRFMSQEDIDALDQIQEYIKIYKEAGVSKDLSYEDRIALTELFKALDSIQTTVENPFYVQEFNSRLEDLELSWANYQSEKEGSEKDIFLEQFLIKEIEFKDWYDNNHTNKYVSKFVSNEAINPLPKKYNTMNIPASEDLMEEVPDYKFTKRVRLPMASNINYQEDYLGYPLPKGLTMDGAEVSGTSEWLNPKYEQIRNNPRVSKFYHSFVGRFLETQKTTTGKLLGYYYPGFEEKSIDDVTNKGVKEGVKNRMKMFRDKNLAVGTDYDFSINGYGTNQDDRIQFKHNTPLPIDQQTTDGVAAVIKWYEQAFVNKAMADEQAVSKSMIVHMETLFEQLSNSDFVGKDKRMEDLRRVINSMKFEYNKYIKGEWKTDQGLPGRVGDLVLRGFSITRMGLDIPNQIGNMLSGNVQAFLGSSKSTSYSGRNLAWAKSKIESRNGLLGAMVRDYGKIGNKSFITKMFMYWNPAQDSLGKYYDKTRTTGQRLAQGAFDLNFVMEIQDKGEIEIASTLWLAVLDNIKVKVVKSRDEQGNITEYEKDEKGNIKTVNVYEAYTENENGEIIIRPDVEWTKSDEQRAQKAVWSEVRRTQGRYADWDKAQAESDFKGRLLLYFRKYLEPAIKNRFGDRSTSYEAGLETVGFYRAFLRAIQIYNAKELIFAIFGAKNTGVSEMYQQKSQMAAREFAVGAALYILGRLIVGAMPDDDEDDSSVSKIVTYNLLSIYSKVDMETRSLIPLLVVGDFKNYIDNLSSFTNAGRDVGRIFQLLEHGGFLVAAQFVDNESEFGELINKSAYYQRNTKLFEKGDAKVLKDLMAFTGYMNVYELFYPEERVKNFKSRINQ
jgi:hypothetical protein